VLIALAGVLGCGPGAMPASIIHPLAGESAPSFRGASTDDREVGVPGRFRTKVTVLDFWASWCDACQEGIPRLNAVWQKYKDDGVMVIGVSLDESEDQALRAVEELHATFPVVLDPGQRIAGAYGVAKVPTTFVVDRNNVVRWVGRGPSDAERAVRIVLRER
jgi:cytochrome c biogenesis protein CcmG/thiol:disulfide interchange protein DsbE